MGELTVALETLKKDKPDVYIFSSRHRLEIKDLYAC